nr:hypothetical protein [uncultured Prevotella sp.]
MSFLFRHKGVQYADSKRGHRSRSQQPVNAVRAIRHGKTGDIDEIEGIDGKIRKDIQRVGEGQQRLGAQEKDVVACVQHGTHEHKAQERWQLAQSGTAHF